MTAATDLAPVVKSVEVSISPEEAFALFTDRMGDWWPKERHSIGGGKVTELVVESKKGGRIIERWHDGTEFPWATFTAFDPPRRFAMEWRPSPDPGPTTEVEVTFTASAAGTIVELTHRGWERLGDAAPEARRSYDEGWTGVLSLYGSATS